MCRREAEKQLPVASAGTIALHTKFLPLSLQEQDDIREMLASWPSAAARRFLGSPSKAPRRKSSREEIIPNALAHVDRRSAGNRDHFTQDQGNTVDLFFLGLSRASARRSLCG